MPLPAGWSYLEGVVQLGDDAVLLAANGSEGQLLRIELDGSSSPLAPAAPGAVTSVARGADGILTAVYLPQGSSSHEVVRLVDDAWVPFELTLEDGSPVGVTGVFATPSSETYALAPTSIGPGPLLRIEGEQLVVEEGVAAVRMMGLGLELWALAKQEVFHWDGAVWSPSAELPEPCNLGAVVASDDAMCASPGHTPVYWDGASWSEAPISGGSWVQGLVAGPGPITALGNANDLPVVSTWSGSAWMSTVLDLFPEVARVDVGSGGARLSDGRLVFVIHLISGPVIDETMLVIEQAP